MNNTLHLKDQHRAGNGQRQGGGFRTKPKYEGKGHDALLRKLIEEKRELVIETMSGIKLSGRIVTADKYTITLECETDGKQYKPTVYKHGIEFFYAVEA